MKQSKKYIAPGYFNKKPLLKSISEIKSTIGFQDSCIQTNQVAVLYLEEQSNQGQNQENFIKDLCAKYRISLGTSDFEHFKLVQYKSYILQTYNLIEPFFKSLNESYRFYNNLEPGEWKPKDGDKNLDSFNLLILNFENSKAHQIKLYPEYYLLDYYRQIRNSIVHLQESEIEHEKTTKYFENHINDRLQYFKRTYKLDAPNEPAKISFNDFMLYTRAIKYFSNILNDLCFPETNTLVLVAEQDSQLQKVLLQSKNITDEKVFFKRINALRRFFHLHFNIHHSELRDEFCKAYLNKEGVIYSDYL